jgi:hypothetical protein
MPEEKEIRDPGIDYQKKGIDELVENLKADVKKGLFAAEVKKRINDYGYNEIPGKKANPSHL